MSGGKADGARGRLVVFEGGDSVGKTTHSRRLAERLDAVLTREPGGTPLGRELRRLLLDESEVEVAIATEALLMAADRAQHVAEVIRPALAAGRDVVSDRYLGSSLAYQGYGRGLDLGVVRGLSEFATGGLLADLVILLDMDPEQARSRSSGSDRFEALDSEFHRRVRQGFLELAAADPLRWVVVDAARNLAAVQDEIAHVVAERLANQ